MKYTEYVERLSEISALKKWVWWTVSILVLSNLLLVTRMLFVADKSRTIIIPAVISKSFWVDDEKVSKEYLNEMGVFFAQLMYNVTPASANNRHNLLLGYVSSELYSALDKEIQKTENIIKQTNVSTYFTPTEVGTDEEKMITVLTGEFVATQGDKVVQRQQRELTIKFKYTNGKIQVTEFNDKSKIDFQKGLEVDPNKSTVVDKTGKVTEKTIGDGDEKSKEALKN